MPYEPGVVDRSGEIMAAGISGAANTIAGAITQHAQDLKQTKAFRLMAVDGLGMDPEKVDKMSLEDLQAHMQGLAVKAAQQTARAKAEDMQSQMEERKAAATQRNQEMMAQRDYNQAYSSATAPDAALSAVDMMRRSPITGDVGGAIAHPTVGMAMTPELNNRLMAQANLSPRQRFDLARASKAMGPGEDNNAPVIFTEDPVTGSRFAGKGKVLSPSGVNPSKIQPPEAIALHDEDGNPNGMTATHDGKRWVVKATPKVASGELLPVLDPVTKKPVQGLGMDASGKVHDFRTQIQKMVNTPEAEGAAPAKYDSAEAVRSAYAAGTLSKVDASKILKDQFGFK